VTLAAPGCAMVEAIGNRYTAACGTSFSAPLVAGAAGLIASAHPGATAQQIATALEAGADRIGDSQYGRLDVAKALAAFPGSTPPTLLGAPSVTGTTTAGRTLSASPGTWLGGPTAFSYQWLRCTNAGCVPIAGASQPTYTTTAADVGRWLEVQVTASSGSGEASGRSDATGFVVAQPHQARHRR